MQSTGHVSIASCITSTLSPSCLIAIRQDGDNVDVIQEAIDTCPVDCIHWVKFEELDDLENSLDRDMFQSFGKPPRMNKH